MSDLIDRRAAVDFIDAGHLCNPNEPRWSDNEVVNFLKSRPSAQPERKTGRWINYDSSTERYDDIKCSNCGKTFTVDSDRYCDIGFIVNDLHYCPNCGAKMEVEHED